MKALIDALQALHEGRYARVDRQASLAWENGAYPALASLTGARAAQRRRDFKRRDEWLPSDSDKAFVKSLMQRVSEPGKIANWVAPPARGIHGKPVEYEYVKFN